MRRVQRFLLPRAAHPCDASHRRPAMEPPIRNPRPDMFWYSDSNPIHADTFAPNWRNRVSHLHAGHSHEGHSHAGHSHAHAPPNFGRVCAIAAFLNISLVVIQVVYGVLAHSVALLADAGHNFGDVVGLLLAWGAHGLSGRSPTKRYTYGFGSASILAALLNAIILLMATGAIAWEAVHRLLAPAEVAGTTVMVVALLGIVINGVSALMLMAGSKRDLHIRGAFLHMIADAEVSLGLYGVEWTSE